ncbi:MAG: head GIN domain-containing protein [Salinimicrobium sp.]
MRRSIFILALLALSIQTANAQWWSGSKKIKGNGNMKTENRKVSDYDAVELEGSMNVQLVAGNEGALKVEAESNLLEYIVTEVNGDELKISTKEGYSLSPSGNHKILVTVPFREISAVTLTGSGDIRTSDKITAENFEVKITGSGDIKLPLQAKNARASITGSGDIDLVGSARDFDCKVTGSGDISAFEFKCENVDATVTGSGDIQVYASEELRAKVPGAGDIEYKGNPKKQDFKTIGVGSISKR